MRLIGLAAMAAFALPCFSAAPAFGQGQIVLDCIPPALRDLPMSRVPRPQMNAVVACIVRRTAEQLNEQTPIRMGEDVLDSVIAADMTMFYNYRLSVDGADFPRAEREALGARTRANACASDMRQTIRLGASFGYNWFDRSGRLLHQILVDRC